MTPEEVSALYRTASTLDDIAALLRARGMPELANYAPLILRNTNPHDRPWWARQKAHLIDSGTIPGALAFREKQPADVARALRWIAEVCERGMRDAEIQWAKREEFLNRPAPRCDKCGADMRPGVDCCAPKPPKKKRAKRTKWRS